MANEHQRDSVVGVRRNYNIPARLENGLDERFRRVAWDRIYFRDYRRNYCRGICGGFSDNFALDREVKNVRPAGQFERMAKNQNTERKRKEMKRFSIGDALAILSFWIGVGTVAYLDIGKAGSGALSLVVAIMACCLSWQIIKRR